jgi:urease accessory protein
MNLAVNEALSERGVHAASDHGHSTASCATTVSHSPTPVPRTPSPLNGERAGVRGEAVRKSSLSPSPRGQASLEVQIVSGESAVTSSYATSPLKLLTPRSRGQSVWAYTSSFGGGLVAGDQTRLDLRIGSGARCFLGTQASTKIYRNPAALPSGHQTRATLEAGSLLVFAPDPVQAFAGSIYAQRQEFHLAPDASLVLLDWFTSGRAARGERWEFNRFQSRNEVWREKGTVRVTGDDSRIDQHGESPSEIIFLDSLLLTPDDSGALTTPHRMGRFNCLATLLLVGPAVRDFAAQQLEQFSKEPVTRRATLVASASPVAGGAVLRIAGEDVEAVGQELHRQLACLRDLLGDDPWARKW